MPGPGGARVSAGIASPVSLGPERAFWTAKADRFLERIGTRPLPTWTDDFNRPDGPLTAPWVQGAYMPSIQGAHAYAGNNGAQAVVSSQSSAAAHDASITLTMSAYGPLLNSVIVKANIGVNGYYYFYLAGNSGAYQAIIARAGAAVTLATAYLPVVLPDPTVLRLTYNTGNLYGIVNGVTVVWARDTLLDANLYCGIGVGRYSPAIDSFSMNQGAVTGFSVTPSAAMTGGPPILLTLIGTGTAWTPGTPGSPTFTASAGSLSGQDVTSVSTAAVYFTPPLTDQTVTITDPSTGLTAPVYCNAYGTTPPPGGWGPLLTPAGADIINSAEVPGSSPRVTTDYSIVIPGAMGAADLTLLSAISDIWYAHYATWAGTPPSQASAIGRILHELTNASQDPAISVWPAASGMPLMHQLDLLRSLFLNTEETDYVTIQQVLTAVLAIGTPDLGPVRADIGIAGQSTWTSILEILLAMWGDQQPTLTDIAGMIADLSTIAGYTLGDVKTWIEAIPPTDLGVVLDKLDAIQPSELTNLSTIATQVGTVDTVVDGIAASLAALRAPGDNTLQDVLDAIAGLSSQISGLAGPAAPIWPGNDLVTVGASVPLSDGLEIAGPLHGLLISITSAPAGTGRYRWGDLTSYTQAGGVTFQTDRGEWEFPQPIGLVSYVVCPRAMSVASAARVRLGKVFTGTVRPWSRT